MTARATAAVLLVTLGSVAAFAVTNAPGDPPIRLSQATVYVTVTERHVVLYQHHGTRWWAAHAVRARREANARRITLNGIRARLHDRWAPTVDYALRLASSVFGVSYYKMRSVAWCESRFQPWATNGKYSGLFQLGWSPFGFSPYDPIANALSAAQTVAHDGSWRQWECG